LIGACEKRNSSSFILARLNPVNSLIINQLMKRSGYTKGRQNQVLGLLFHFPGERYYPRLAEVFTNLELIYSFW
jgi:hypothetical protein